ncbi:MAG: nucleotidyltransferase family protein [Gemmatimonadaceae bacterium]
MTPAPASAPFRVGRMPVSAIALRLAFGMDRGLDDVHDWAKLFEVARSERCAALAWTRCGEAIRRHAPPELAERWRLLFRDISIRGHAQFAESATSSARLSQAGVTPILLKGMLLAHRLYGDATVRACTDIDWFIPAMDRLATRALLTEKTGWRHYDGELPWDEALERQTSHGNFHLEIHSTLLHRRFSYLPVLLPESEAVVLNGQTHLRHSGNGVPGYLAMHLASHAFPPLLWFVDFATLWDSLTEPERGGARRAAEKAGLRRYLAWACDVTAAARRASEGESRSQRRIGIRRDSRTDSHPFWRHVRLAPTAGTALKAVRSWIAPPWVEGASIRIAARIPGRILHYWRATLPQSRRVLGATSRNRDGVSRAWASARVTEVAGSTMLQVVGEVVREGGEMWIVTTGKSMLPTIAPGDRVLLGAPKGVRRGHIVLAAVNGLPLLHRVVSAAGGTIVTRGDGCETNDRGVPQSCVVARAVALKNNAGVSSLSPTLRFGGRALLRFARSGARLIIARRVQAQLARERSARRWA